MRRIFVFLFLAAFGTTSSVWAQEYFPLNPGTKKYFQASINQTIGAPGNTMTFTVHSRNTEEVVGAAKVYDKPAILVRTSRLDSVVGRPIGETQSVYRIENYYQTRPQGVFLLANFQIPSDQRQKPESTRYEPPLQVLKLSADTAASWTVGTMKLQGIKVDLGAKVLGREDVEVPAGSFKSCLKTRSSSSNVSGAVQGVSGLAMNVGGGEFSSTSWYAPGVGLVKQEVSSRFVMTSPNMAPGMTAELIFQQTQLLTRIETSPTKDKNENQKK